MSEAFKSMLAEDARALAALNGRRSGYRPRPTSSRSRRSKAEVQDLRGRIYDACATHHPLTVRNLFYLLVSAGAVEKTEAAYKNIVIRLAGLMREEGELPWEWLVDSTRWMRKPRSYTGLPDLLKRSAEFYRRDLWAQNDEYVEVWCESESIAGVLFAATAEFDVPLMAARGFSSKAFLFESAATIARNRKTTTIYYIGDYDPSGVVARNDVERRLEKYLTTWFRFRFMEDFHFEPLAVTEAQIRELDLATKPPKTRRNTHATSIRWPDHEGTVEAEAIEPDILRAILREAIEGHLPEGHLDTLRRIESEERQTLIAMQRQVEAQ